MPKGSEAIALVPQEARSKLVILLGSGNTGKSFFGRWIAETAERRRPLCVIDADPNNQTLAANVPGTELPPAVEGEDKRNWLLGKFEGLISADTTKRHDILLDVGGGDLLLKRLSGEVQLAQSLEDAGIDVVAIYMLSPNVKDLAVLEGMEAGGLFRPRHTILMMNLGLVDATSKPEVAFHSVLQTRIVAQVLGRGGRLAQMPRMPCVQKFEAANPPLPTFASALPTPQALPIGLLFGGMMRRWLADMEKVRASLADVLP